MQITKTIRPDAEVALAGVLPKKTVEAFYEQAVAAAIKEVAVPGFRKGHVPRERVIEEVGVSFLWKDAAERALRDALDDILKKEEVNPILPLALSITTDEPQVDVAFEIVATVAPTCTVGDYKAVAAKALGALPTDDISTEEAQARAAFRTQVRALIAMQKGDAVKEGDAKANEEKADTPLSDDEAKHVGFENADAAEFFIKGEAEKAVADRAQQKKRGAVAEALIAEAVCSLPRVLVAEEARSMLELFKKDIVAQGMEWNTYLARVNKTEAQVRDDLLPNAQKRITLELVFGEILNAEKLALSDEDKKKAEELAHKLVDQGAEHQRAHQYANESLLREKIWAVLGVNSDTAVS